MRSLWRASFCVILFVAISASLVVEAQQEQQTQQPASEKTTSGWGLFDALVSPLYATLRQAKRLLGHHGEEVIGNVEDLVGYGFNKIQVQAFKLFAMAYNKTYSPAEIPRRLALFWDRRKQIEESVRAFAEGRSPFVMHENTFVDWDEQELKTLVGAKPPRNLEELSPEEREARLPGESKDSASNLTKSNNLSELKISADDDDDDGDNEINSSVSGKDLSVRAGTVRLPAQKDWRTSNCVAEVMNQDKCGCCYAIATMNTLETQRCIQQETSPTLSSQQIIDCSTPRAGYKNYGCDGGWPTRVLRYLQDVGVTARDRCYPFVKRQEACKLSKVQFVQGCSLKASISKDERALKFKVLNNERDILYHVATTGPVITVMQASDRFLYYGSGIFDDPQCSRKEGDVDHAISIVGYGRENGVDYWLIKNSWGKSWGIDGFGKYRRGKNACSIGHWGWVIMP